MKTEKFVKKYIGTLEHFLEQGGYPLRANTGEAVDEAVALSKAIPALVFDDGLLSRDTKKEFPDKVLVEFWKFKYKEALSESNKLYALIRDSYEKASG